MALLPLEQPHVPLCSLGQLEILTEAGSAT